jgi:serine/threonine protein kinase
LHRSVALKVIASSRAASSDHKRRFLQEARAASALNHPNIATVYDIAEEGGVHYIAMEYVEGRPLNTLIPREGLDVEKALRYAVQIAEALAAAHNAGIVHRDVKPGNVIVTGQGTVKVLDFGLAKLAEPARGLAEMTTQTAPATAEGLIVGTVAYMSPEQAEGKPVDARSDIFSFGCVLYEMLTGRRPFEGDSKISTLAAILQKEPAPVRELVPAVPAEVERVVMRCLRKDPARRFQTMADLKVALEELKEQSDSGSRSSLRNPKPAVSARLRAGIAAALVIAAATAGVVLGRVC